MRFSQVDVFSSDAFRGNPVAVVHDADELDDATMAAFANWTNLSETTFLLAPTTPGADYRLRIFTVGAELPFAGHPTLGSCRAWLEAGGVPGSDEVVVQECGVGLVPIRRGGEQLAFAAPGFLRSGPLDDTTRSQALRALGLADEDVLQSAWIDNGPGWLGLVLRDAATVLALRPDFVAMGDLDIGVIGPHPDGDPADFEVRAFSGLGSDEDPVTGSLSAGFGVWLIGEGWASTAFTVAQGTALGRTGRVDVRAEDGPEGRQVWVGGSARARIVGTVDF